MSDIEIFNITALDGLIILAAYLVGGISSGYILVRVRRGIDVRSTGSRSTGATNVGRILGRPGFYLTLIGDLSKAGLVVWLVRWLNYPPGIVGAVAVAVISGHIWSAWLGFHGGKGIASSLGAYLALDYTILLIGGVALLVAYLITRNFLTSWILTLVTIPLLAFLLNFSIALVLPLAVTAVIVLYAHRDNIKEELSQKRYRG
ncbi:MAG: glycerol-3-phosphate acyltransferase [Gammaproteobacteria bacterium]